MRMTISANASSRPWMSSTVIAGAPRARGAGRRPARSSPMPRDALTSTASPSRRRGRSDVQGRLDVLDVVDPRGVQAGGAGALDDAATPRGRRRRAARPSRPRPRRRPRAPRRVPRRARASCRARRPGDRACRRAGRGRPARNRATRCSCRRRSSRPRSRTSSARCGAAQPPGERRHDRVEVDARPRARRPHRPARCGPTGGPAPGWPTGRSPAGVRNWKRIPSTPALVDGSSARTSAVSANP